MSPTKQKKETSVHGKAPWEGNETSVDAPRETKTAQRKGTRMKKRIPKYRRKGDATQETRREDNTQNKNSLFVNFSGQVSGIMGGVPKGPRWRLSHPTKLDEGEALEPRNRRLVNIPSEAFDYSG
jgi:hypothetical protein